MATQLRQADLAFLITQLLPGSQGVSGVTDPFSLLGLREIAGTNNNLTNVVIVDQYGNTIDTNLFANSDQPFFNVSNFVPLENTQDNNYTPGATILDDSSPRIISNLVVDMSAANPYVPDDAFGNPSQPAFALPPTNSLFTFFGQFFDHGLDFIDKGDSGSIMIPLPPNDPLMNPANPFLNNIPLDRATLVGGETNNSTAPLVEQSQTYGQNDATSFYLKEYVDQGGPPTATPQNAIATGRLVTNADGGMATWADIKQNALLGAGIELLDIHALDVPDPTLWVPGTGFPDGPAVGDQLGAGTGQAFLADIAFSANPANAGYDDALLADHKVAGDGRVNENTALTSIHEAFHSEHNRIVKMVEDLNAQRQLLDPNNTPDLSGEQKFQTAKLINEMQYQHFAFEEFARRMSPNIDAFAQYDLTINPNISAEFSQAIYRLGHSMLTDVVRSVDAAGDTADMSLVDAFLNPRAFDAVGGGALIEGQTRQQSNLIDEHVVDSLRNFLLGVPLDLAAINIARGRDVGLPTLNQLREQLFAETNETTLAPYTSWADFGAHMLHPASLVNFIAAYGEDGGGAGTLQAFRDAGDNAGARARAEVLIDDAVFMGAAGDQGFRLIDLWLGALAEEKATGPLGDLSQLGTTADFIFAQQMLALQNGDRLYYLARLGGTNILDEIEASTFGDLYERGTGARHTNGDIFSTADEYVELVQPADNNRSGADFTTAAEGDWHEVIGGTTGTDTISTGAGNDTIWGEAGDDTLDGGIGDDQINGGDGDDTIIGGEGVDFLRGNAGDDTIFGDAGDDLIFGQDGNDTIFGGNDIDEVFGGFGNDTIDGGAQDDALFGQENDDIIDGGAGNDAIDGGSENDSLKGNIGDDTLISGDGVNVLVGGAGADVLDGTFGLYDLAWYGDSSVGLVIDLGNPAASTGDAIGDTFIGIEEVGGSTHVDDIRGDDLANTLSGRGGDIGTGTGDTIDGLGGDDVIYDNAGLSDTLFGGAHVAADQLVLLGRTADQFTNYNVGTDTILGIDPTITSLLTEVGAGGAVDTLLGFEELAFDDGIWSTVTNEWLPLIGVPASAPLSVDGVEIDPNFVSTATITDGDVIPNTIGADGISVGTIELVDRDGFVTLPSIAIGGIDVGAFRLGPQSLIVDNPDGSQQITQELFFTGGPSGGTARTVNYEVQQVYNITIDGADGVGGSGINFALNIQDANDNAPLFTSPDSLYVQENVNLDTVIYRATSTDLDTVDDLIAPGETVAYTLTDDAAGLFEISNNGEVTFASAPPAFDPGVAANNLHTFEVTASDGTNLATQAVTVRVKPTPVFSSAPVVPILWAENTPTTIVINDPLGGPQVVPNPVYDADAAGPAGLPIAYVLGGPDAAHFNLDSLTGVLSFVQSPDFETPLDADGDNVYDVTIGATNSISTTPQAVSVQVTNVGGVNIVGTAGTDVVMPNFTTLTVPPTLPTNEEDIISGLAGIDVISGGAGNDRIEGGEDNDSIDGGLGLDTVVSLGSYLDFAVTANNDDGSIVYTDINPGDGDLGSDTLSNIERIDNGATAVWEVQLGTADPDTLVSSTPLYDIMNGGGGADTLTGGIGGGIFGGGTGDDIIDGGDGLDTVVSFGSYLNFTVTANNDDGSIVYTDINPSDGDLGSDTLSNIERIDNGNTAVWEVQLGTAAVDNLTSSTPLYDIMNGGGGGDTLTGGAGGGIFGGGSGDDTIDGGDGFDTVVSFGSYLDFAVTEFNDNGSIVYTDINPNDGDLGSDTLSNIERIDNGNTALWEVQLGTAAVDNLTSSTPLYDIMNGGGGGDTLTGGAGGGIFGGGSGDDTIDGGAGDDTIDGGLGSDILTGGAGGGDADTFVFASALSALNVDTITDFAVGTDVISLDSAVFTALSAPPDLTAAEFVVGAAAGDATDRIIYDSATGDLSYDEDGTGVAVQQQFATLATGLALSETDFVIV